MEEFFYSLKVTWERILWCKHPNCPPKLFVSFQKVTDYIAILSMDKHYSFGWLSWVSPFLLVCLFNCVFCFLVFLGEGLVLFACLVWFDFFPKMCFNPIKGITVFHLTPVFISLEGKFKHEFLGMLHDGMYQCIIEWDSKTAL